MQQRIAAVIFSFIWGIGCSNGGGSSLPVATASLNADKSCNEKFRTDYKAFRYAFDLFDVNAAPENIAEVKKECDTFRANHAQTVVCPTTDMKDGKPQKLTLQASPVYEACSKIDDIVKSSKSSKN